MRISCHLLRLSVLARLLAGHQVCKSHQRDVPEECLNICKVSVSQSWSVDLLLPPLPPPEGPVWPPLQWLLLRVGRLSQDDCLLDGARYLQALARHTVVNICAGWMILIQVMATCALITSITAQLVSVSLFLRVPIQVVLRWEVSICTDIQLMIILDLRGDLWQFWWFSTSCLPCSCWSQSRWGHTSHWPEVSLSEQVFPLCCWRRDYLLYPNYNYLSWSYAAGLASILACLSSIGCLYQVNDTHLWHSRTSLSSRNWWKWRTEKRKTCQFSINFIPNWTQVTTPLMPVQ